MGGRKPPGVSFETWVDRQIREGLASGAFDDLPRGPVDLGDTRDDDWWIKRKVREEGLDVLPASLVLRRDLERAVVTARGAPTEDEAREQIETVNERIRAANRIAMSGPPVVLVTYDVEAFLAGWRATHPRADATPPQPSAPEAVPTRGAPARRWFRRR